MKVKILRETGLEEALIGLSLSYNAPLEKMPKVAKRLAARDNGENKFLESIQVWLDVTAPRYWWQQFDTYRVGVTKQSESTMHTWKRRAFSAEAFVEGVDPMILAKLECARQGGDFGYVKRNLPEGFLQRRVVCTNYKVLRHVVRQRRDHKLVEWTEFILALGDLAHSDWIGETK